jgi:hypothetical protein
MFEKYLKVSGFIPFPLSGNTCYLDENGKIKNERGQVIPQTLDSDGYPQVFADLWDGVRQYRIVDLMAIVFKSVKLQYNQWNEIEGFYIDGDVKNSHAGNIGYRFRTFPLQCTRFPDFYHIPMFSRYGINREGELISLGSGVNVKGTYKVLTDVKTGDRFYFPSVLDCVRFLKTVNSKPVFERRVRSGELLDGKYKCSTYTLASHQPSV